jgi:hypothetical protein
MDGRPFWTNACADGSWWHIHHSGDGGGGEFFKDE